MKLQFIFVRRPGDYFWLETDSFEKCAHTGLYIFIKLARFVKFHGVEGEVGLQRKITERGVKG